MDLRAAQKMTDSGQQQVDGSAPAGAAAADTEPAPADSGSFAGMTSSIAIAGDFWPLHTKLPL